MTIRPTTIVAIVTGNGEQIALDRFRGVYATTPQSTRMNILANYVIQLMREWAASESGVDLSFVDAILEIERDEKRGELLKRFKDKDARDHQQPTSAAFTRDLVLTAAKSARDDGAPEHKVASTVARNVGISAQHVRTILRSPTASKKAKVRK